MPTVDDVFPLAVPDGVPVLLRDLIHERTGLYFEPDRLDMLLDKLRDRAVHHQCHSYLDYYYILKYGDTATDEWHRVMDAFSVQETYFWREYSQIQALTDTLVPNWLRAHPTTPLQVWSAACASGEEPYSLVMALAEAGFGSAPIEVYASDASDAALQKARRAVFRERSFRVLPDSLRHKYFSRHEDGWQLDPAIARRVTFHQANIAAPGDIVRFARAPVVFCRNVFIYFSADAIRRTVASFAQWMPDHGHLFVGASESLLKVTPDYELREIGDAFVYIRRPRAAVVLP